MGTTPDQWLTYGDPDRFGVGLAWDGAGTATTADEVTGGRFWLSVAGVRVWDGGPGREDGGFHWTMVDLLEFLARVWPRLLWEQRDPLGLDAPLPELRRRAKAGWDAADLDPERLDREERRLWGFLEAHDLASGFGGIELPSVFVLRQGHQVVVQSREDDVTLRFEDVSDTLTSLGEEIAARLRAVDDPRAAQAVSAWVRRDEVAPAIFVRLATGLDERRLVRLAGARSVLEAFEVTEAANDNELLAVARLGAQRVASEDLAMVLERVRSAPSSSHRIAAVDALGPLLRAHLASLGLLRRFEQGQAAAVWLRAHLGVPCDPIDPAELVREWGIEIDEMTLETPSLEAVSVWGPTHGPLVLLNRNGRRTKAPAGRRATIAHELAHLLMDRAGALPLAEVLGGRAPLGPEQRANAFAAELLLPREVAADAFVPWTTSRDASRCARGLMRRYGVSRAIVGWQALRSDRAFDPAVRRFLKNLLPPEQRDQVED